MYSSRGGVAPQHEVVFLILLHILSFRVPIPILMVSQVRTGMLDANHKAKELNQPLLDQRWSRLLVCCPKLLMTMTITVAKLPRAVNCPHHSPVATNT